MDSKQTIYEIAMLLVAVHHGRINPGEFVNRVEKALNACNEEIKVADVIKASREIGQPASSI